MQFQELGVFGEHEVDRLLYEAKSLEEFPDFGDTLMGDKASDIGLVLQHGFIGSNLDMLYIGDILAKGGYRVLIPLLPGHGMDAKALMDFTHLDWIEKNKEAIDYLKAEKKGRSIILVGHSLGGTLSLINASERDDIAGIVTISTPTRFPIIKHLLGLLASVVIKKINMKYDDFYFEDERLFENPYTKFLMKNYGKISYYIIGEVFKAIDKSYKILGDVSIPSLIIVSPKDNAIPKRSAFDLYKKIGSDTKEVKYYDNSYHMLIADASKEEVAEKVLNFVKSL